MSDTTDTATQAAPEGETALATPETVPAPGTETPAEQSTEQTTPAEPEAPKAEEEDETQKRLARAEYERREARRQMRAMEAELAALRQDKPPEPGSQEDIARQVREEAARLVRVNAFNAECNRIYADGVKDFPDFAAALAGFQEVKGGLSEAMIEAAAEAGPAHKVIHFLGKNPEEAERIAAMSPARMGAAIARIAAKVNAPPPPVPVSKAPPPIKPVASGQIISGPSDEQSIDDWMAARNKQARA